MNYFDLHIGDYDQATAHLSACEDGIYGRLLRRYYATEKPLELDMGLLQRKVRARTKEEKQAVLDVLSEFFSQQPDGWHQKTCDEVLEKFLAGAPERDAKKANAETRLQRHREERAALFSIINAAGEHYPYNTQIAELRAHAVRIQSATPETPLQPSPATFHATAPATPATATQYPVPNTHNPVPNTLGESGAKARRTRRVADAITLSQYLEQCKRDGKKPVPEDHYIRRDCEAVGITSEMLQVAWVNFRKKYVEDEKTSGKRYKDWPGHFANAISGRWGGLWVIDPVTNLAQWSSTGLQQRGVLDAKARAKQEGQHEHA